MHRITDYNANLTSVVRLRGKDPFGLGGPCMDPIGLGEPSSSNMDDSANLAYQHLNKLKEKRRILEEENLSIRQTLQDPDLSLELDKVEMPELMKGRLSLPGGGLAVSSAPSSALSSAPSSALSSAPSSALSSAPSSANQDSLDHSFGGVRSKITNHDVNDSYLREDLLDLDLIDIDALEGDEQNWLTGPDTQEKEDDDCLQWLRADMEANQESLLQGRIFYKTSFNSSFNSSALSGCSRNSSKIGSPESASTPSKPYRGIETRSASGLPYQHQLPPDINKLRIARNTGYHRLAYGGPEQLNRTVEIGEDRKPGGLNTTFPHIDNQISDSSFTIPNPLGLGVSQLTASDTNLHELPEPAFAVPAESTPMPEKTRRTSNINTATMTRPRGMKTVIRTSNYAANMEDIVAANTPNLDLMENLDLVVTKSPDLVDMAASNQQLQCNEIICDTTFDKDLSGNRTFDQQDLSQRNRTYDEQHLKNISPGMSTNRTSPGISTNRNSPGLSTNRTSPGTSTNSISPGMSTNRTSQSPGMSTNRTYDSSPPQLPLNNRTFEPDNNRTFDDNSPPTIQNTTYDEHQPLRNRTFEGQLPPRLVNKSNSPENKTFDSQQTVSNRTFEGQLTVNRTFEGQVTGNRSFDGQSNVNQTFDGNPIVNRTFESQQANNLTFDGQSVINQTFESQQTVNRTLDGQSTVNRTFESQQRVNRTLEGQSADMTGTMDGLGSRKMSEDRNSSANSSQQMSRESSNDGLLEDMDVLSGEMDRLSTASGLSESSASHRLNDVQDVQDMARIQQESLRNPQSYQQLRSATLSPNSEASLSSPQADEDTAARFQSQESLNSENGATLVARPGRTSAVNPAYIQNNRKYSNRGITSRYSSEDSLPDSPYSSQSLDTRTYQDTDTCRSMPNLNRYGNRTNNRSQVNPGVHDKHGLGNQNNSEGKLQQPRQITSRLQGPSTRVGRPSLNQHHNQQLKHQQQQHSTLQQQQQQGGADEHQFTRPVQPPVQPVRKFSGIARPSAPSTRMGGRPSTAGAPGAATRLPAPGSRIARASSRDRRPGSVGPTSRLPAGHPQQSYQNRNGY